ncbi:HAMP domain-containing histidine kinase [Bacillus sp. RG28]|uniref:histidine kinase n=1 Tax=Gottfriedia endophytica TaxID=2820819 RepID=A0A940NK96_9BACI|nr:HAMP domain-containing sensor histidine kinase [Gottfriedia endophytica]MBP0726849.1 HAMP domain-containing histidine kinase [Gottfriedia endophytica]
MLKTKPISLKLGISFLFLTLVIETLLFFILYVSLVNSRVNEEIESLLARGNSHRDVLEKHFNEEVIHHVALMESESNTKVVIQSINGNILGKSHQLDPLMKKHLKINKSKIKESGSVIHSDWKDANYISTVSPIIINNKVEGYVYMFLQTSNIQDLVSRLKIIFIVTGLLTFITTIITIIILSKILTRPLLRMKEETEKMAQGNLSVELDLHTNDEINELATSIQRLANELNFMKKERNEFLASVAHELRTPLTFIRGYADIATRASISEEERTKYLHIITEEADHITKLVEELMLLAQMEQHNFHIQKQITSIESLLSNVYEKTLPTLLEKNIKLTINCEEDLTANIDKIRIEQVLFNLIMNSFKYSSSNSFIQITVSSSDQNLQLVIKDYGDGIPQEDLPHIFKRFYRVDKSRTRSKGGTGLGLAIAYDIINLHNGTISVGSEVGQGAIFTIIIPL